MGGALEIAFAVLVLAILLCILRAARGPAEPDRLAALALVMVIAVGVMATLAIARADWRYLDVALVLSLLAGVIPIAAARALRDRPVIEVSSEDEDLSHVVGD
jgi:multicomponent Na+:H+ antiporter subunit F